MYKGYLDMLTRLSGSVIRTKYTLGWLAGGSYFDITFGIGASMSAFFASSNVSVLGLQTIAMKGCVPVSDGGHTITETTSGGSKSFHVVLVVMAGCDTRNVKPLLNASESTSLTKSNGSSRVSSWLATVKKCEEDSFKNILTNCLKYTNRRWSFISLTWILQTLVWLT